MKRNWNLDIPLPHVHSLQHRWPQFVLTTLAEAVQERFGGGVRTQLPQDFQQIANHSRPRNYIGFIYADGNRMGETIKNMGTNFAIEEEAKQAYTAFSAIVDEATRQAVAQSVLEYVDNDATTTPRKEPARFIPAEFVLAGGDDLILVVPAQSALRVTARFIALFQERTRTLQEQWIQKGALTCPFAPKGLTISAGVVLAHASYPASQLLDLAGELMKFAKRSAADLARQKKHEGTLDFMVLHTPGSESMKQRRKTEYEYVDSHNGRHVKRTERPYTASGVEQLLQRISKLKALAIPSTQLKALYPFLFQGTMRAQFEAQYIKTRLQATGVLQEPILQG